MNKFVQLFGRARSVIIGMVHIRALPGSPKASHTMNEIIELSCSEAETYRKANVDGIMLENMHDVPWRLPHQLTPETVACMSAVSAAVRRENPDLPMGIQVLSCGNKEAMAIAKATGLNFIRSEGFVYSHIADEGLVNSCAAELLRYRNQIQAQDVMVFTDIKKKHCSHTLTSDVSIEETARAAQMFLSDGLIVTGRATGEETSPDELHDVQNSVELPVLVGSGVTEDNIATYLSANGIIIGSHLKMHGLWHSDLDPTRVGYFMSKVEKLRDLSVEPQSESSTEFPAAQPPIAKFPPILSQGE